MTQTDLKAWLLDEAARKVTSRHPYFASRHIDEIGYVAHEDARDVAVGLVVLRTISRLRDEIGLDVVAKLAVPFGDSAVLDTTLPALDDIPVMAPYEPPSLYLFGPRFLELRPDREEYRCPYPDSPWGADVDVEYACGRSMYERERGWEFVKTIWVSLRNGARDAT